MAKKVKERLTITQGDMKITIEGSSDSYGGADLQLKALLSLMDFDFKFLEEEDMNIRSKFYLTILDRLGELMKSDDPNESTDDNVMYVKKCIEWWNAQKAINDPEIVSFMRKYLGEPDEE
jgi:hypothetical protein